MDLEQMVESWVNGHQCEVAAKIKNECMPWEIVAFTRLLMNLAHPLEAIDRLISLLK